MSPSTRGGDDRLIAVGAVPRADLLPPELKAEVKLRAQRRLMGFIVVLAVVLVVGGYLYAFIQATANGLRLDASTATTQSLTEQKAQYIEVTEVQTQVEKAKAAQIVATSTEINWKKYLNLVLAALPLGAEISSATMETSEPGVIDNEPEEPLAPPSLASMSFVVTTPTLPNVSDLIENLGEIPGYAYGAVSTISRADDGRYVMAMVVYLNEEALESRYIDSGEDEDEDDDASAEEETP